MMFWNLRPKPWCSLALPAWPLCAPRADSAHRHMKGTARDEFKTWMRRDKTVLPLTMQFLCSRNPDEMPVPFPVLTAVVASGTPDVSAVSRRLMQPLVSVTVSDPGGTATITASLQLSATRCACARACLAAPVTPRAVSR